MSAARSWFRRLTEATNEVTRASAGLVPLIPLLIMAVVVGVTYLRIVWLLPRGMDWTDESFVMSMVASNRISHGEPWGFQHLLNPLYVLTGESVLAFRALRLLGYVALSVALVAVARAVTQRIGLAIPRAGWALVLVFAQVGTFIAWSYPPRYLGYNELGSWFAQLGVALVLLSLAWGVTSRGESSSRVLWPVWVALGVLTTLLVFAKVTTGVAFAALLAVAILVPNRQLPLWKRAVGAAGGGGGMLLLLFITGTPVLPYFRNAWAVATDASAQAAFGHPVQAHLPLYVDSLLTTGNLLLPALVAFTLAMAPLLPRVEGLVPGAEPATRLKELGTASDVGWARLMWIFWGLMTLGLLALPRGETWHYLGYLVVFMGGAAVVGLMIVGGRVIMDGPAAHRVVTVVIGAGALMAAPVMSSVGTNGGFAGHFMFSATLWAVALGVALVLLIERAGHLTGRSRAVPAAVACLVVVLAALAVEHHARNPYRSAPLDSQRTPTSVPELRGLLLTEPEADWIEWVSDAGEALGADGVPAVAISSPGALYVFNHSGYANPWTDAMWPASFVALEVACSERPAALFLLQPGTSSPDEPSTAGTVAGLAACGIDFPDDFEVVDEYRSADPARAMTIWRLADE